jgi:hypothetical protein
MAEVYGTDQRDLQRHPSQRWPKPGVVLGAEDRDLYEQAHGVPADTAEPEHPDATPVPTPEVTATAEAAPRAKLYLVTVEGGITPQVHGPFGDDGERVAEANRLHTGQDPDTDAVFVAEVTAHGGLRVDSFSGAFFDDEEPAR